MNKQAVVYSCSRMLLSNGTEPTTDTHHTEKHQADQKKQGTRVSLYAFIKSYCIKLVSSDGNKISVGRD